MLPVCGGSSVARGWNIGRDGSLPVCRWYGSSRLVGVGVERGVWVAGFVVWCAVGCLRGRLLAGCSECVSLLGLRRRVCGGVGSGVGWCVENCIVDASIFVAKFLRAHGGCLGTRNR